MIKLLILLATSLVASNAQVKQFSEGNIVFSGKLYKELTKSSGNFIASPFSVEVALALTEAGAGETTAQEIITGVSFPNTTNTTQLALKSLLPSCNIFHEDLKLLSANKIFVDNKLTIKATYKEVAESVFQAGAENLDFTNANSAASEINWWVQKETNDKIKNLVSPDSLENAKIVLVNALYFMGKWKFPFGGRRHITTVEKFYTLTESGIEVDMMHTQSLFRYYESETHQAKFLELPYKEGVTMTIILPNDLQGLSVLEDNLETVFEPQPLQAKSVYVSLPKWETETQMDLNSILQNLGVVSLFTSKADLSGISDMPMFVSNVVQKAFINVTESGTEAAASTAAVIGPTAVLPSPKIFLADHPFLYYIKYNDIILFVGKTSIPTAH